MRSPPGDFGTAANPWSPMAVPSRRQFIELISSGEHLFVGALLGGVECLACIVPHQCEDSRERDFLDFVPELTDAEQLKGSANLDRSTGRG